MKAVILAGGYGTRISEETHLRPKPLVEIGGRPILWHILKYYSTFGINDFVICSGYMGYAIKEYFSNYYLHLSDVTFDLSTGSTHVHKAFAEAWSVTIIDTGLDTLTGGRLKRVAKYLDDEPFCFTYGDGLSNVNINDLIKYHSSHGRSATITCVQPPGRYGVLELSQNNQVTSFHEKPTDPNSWINGGFFILEPHCLNLIDGDHISWENEPLKELASSNQLMGFQHHGFWHPMDTLRDKNYLESLWSSDSPPWKTW